MRQLEIAIEDETLEACREYARRRGMSLEEAVGQMLARVVRPARKGWLKECFALMDKTGANSQGRQWKREDLHDV